jgi:uncharacterized protein with HEPN domain
MQRDSRAWLWDVREAAQAIDSFVKGFDATAYGQSELVHSAVERKFEVIGEALNQLSRADAALSARVPHLPQIAAFRNQLVDHDTVWSVVQNSLPGLRSAVDALLVELGAQAVPPAGCP